MIAHKLRLGQPHWRFHPDNPLDPDWKQFLVLDESKITRSTEHLRKTELAAVGDVNKDQAAALSKVGAFDDFGTVGGVSSMGSLLPTPGPADPSPKPEPNKPKPAKPTKPKFDINTKAEEIADDKVTETLKTWAQHILADIGEATKLMALIKDVPGCEGLHTRMEDHANKLQEARSAFTTAMREPTRQKLKDPYTPNPKVQRKS